MKFLEQQFIEQISAEVDNDGNIVIAGIAFAPVAILTNDDSAFTEAFDDWKAKSWLPQTIARADEILDKFNNRERFNDLVGSIRAERVIPFVGSGMSNPCGFPLWADFLRKLREDSTLAADDLEKILLTGDYERAASEIKGNMPEPLFNERIEHTFRIDQGNGLKGAVRYLPYIFKKGAITLNYDIVLETVFTGDDNAFTSVLTGTRISDFRRLSTNGERCLIKYHGDLAQPATRVLTVDEYERLIRK